MLIELKDYKVELKEELTWGDAESIQGAMQKGAKIKGSITNADDSSFEFDTEAIREAKYIAFERVIVSILKGEEKQNFTREWVDNLPVSDGNKLFTEVDKITKKNA